MTREHLTAVYQVVYQVVYQAVYLPSVVLALLGLYTLSLFTQGCSDETRPSRSPVIIEGSNGQGDLDPSDIAYELIWSDEFEGADFERLDPEKWTYDIGGHGWGNQQLEHNTDRVENVSLNGEGQLVITARREEHHGNAYTSARVKTQGLFEFRYGRVEARIKLPTGAGIWPAFWMLGSDFAEAGWPRCGEIDIMEYRGQRPRESTGALHGPGFSAGDSIGGVARSDVDLSLDYHVYAVEWTREGIEWFVDDQRFLRVSAEDVPKGSMWPFNQPFFLILNVAVGGNYVGNPDESTSFPQALTVDYVRVYSRSDMNLSDERSQEMR